MATSCAIAVALLTCPWGFGAFDAFSPVDDGVGPRRVVTEPVAPSAHFKHIVIGLGFAGAELASMLARDGKEFVAFEARHTYGGRAQSFSLESGDVMPKGASWQAGGGAAHPLTERIAECLVETQEQDWDDWTDYRASGEEADVPYDEFDTAIDCVAELAAHNLARGKDDMPLDVGLKLCGWWPVTQDDWLAETQSIEYDFAESALVNRLHKSLPHTTTTAPHTDVDYFIKDERGAEELVGCWLDLHLSSPRAAGRASQLLNYNSPVDNVNTELKTITLRNGTAYSFDTLFDTRSLNVLRWNAVREGGTAYTPRVRGERLRGLLSLHYPLYQKVFFKFPTKFWDGVFSNIMSRSGLAGVVWQSLDAKGFRPGSKVIFATLFSREAERFESMGDKRLKDALMLDLRAVFGAKNVPEPTDFAVSRWRHDEWFRGTYLNLPFGVDSSIDAVRAPMADGSVMWVGEITCENMPGYMHGAILGAQTVYDEWKVRNGETPLMRATPRDNKCFTDTPTDPVGNTILAPQRRRLLGAAQADLPDGGTPRRTRTRLGRRRSSSPSASGSGRADDSKHWREVDARFRNALDMLGETLNAD